MYITQVKENAKDWWKYLIGLVVVFGFLLLFSIPLGVALGIKTATGALDPTRLEDINYLMKAFEPNLNLIFLLLPFVGMLIGTFIAVKFIHGQSLLKLTTTRAKVDWNRAIFAFTIWGIFTSLMLFIDYSFISPEDYELNFKLQPFLILCLIAVILLPLQTSAEEYMFRGYLMQGIGVVFKYKWIALLLTSVGFGLLHYSNPEVERFGDIVMIYYIGTGLFLGIITLMDEGLELALGFHAANNLFTALLVSADWTALQTHSVLKDISNPSAMPLDEVIIPVLIIFPVLILIFARKYGWKNWNERLFGRV